MYKYLLCWRYLRTRYIALASVISVMLGVATMIVVNSVMAGFSAKMRERLHGVLSDVVVESRDLDGFRNFEEVMGRIKQVGGDDVVAMAPTLQTPAILRYTFRGLPYTQPVLLMGIVPEDRAQTGDFAEYLIDGAGKPVAPSFEVSEAIRRQNPKATLLDGETDPTMIEILKAEMPEEDKDDGVILGYSLAYSHVQGNDYCMIPPGTSVSLAFPQAGHQPKATNCSGTVMAYFKSGMSEYDSSYVYMPLRQLQRFRLLAEEMGKGKGAINQIQIKARAGVDLDDLAGRIELAVEDLSPARFVVNTWEHKQGPLLAAVAVEQGILNLLLFFIIAVAGFGILAIFSMIVVEKTRDIGVLKALGASTSGVRGIFLGYGLSLGMVGSGVGLVSGLLFVRHIDAIERGLSHLTGRRVFDPDIYYFDGIPALVVVGTVLWIVAGALFISTAASVFPAQRAARLRPVQALRNE